MFGVKVVKSGEHRCKSTEPNDLSVFARDRNKNQGGKQAKLRNRASKEPLGAVSFEITQCTSPLPHSANVSARRGLSELCISSESRQVPLLFSSNLLLLDNLEYQHLGAGLKCITQEQEDGSCKRKQMFPFAPLSPS
ncbi:unnamed protein product [Pleuronectes platessa]|uniref:Uncharacterized protein n=1 Tax=Pleuronectes platessa TaxID=8262 RepID=A0A9N7YQQ7_PLEPL|nr:unnamed protein product [Pleuronectes platessa]